MTKSSDAPKTNSARKPPQNSFLFNKRADPLQQNNNNNNNQQEQKPKVGVDPRWNAHVYHGNAVKQNVEAQYSFLQDIAAEDQKKRFARLKILSKEKRIRQREERDREMEEMKTNQKKGKKDGKKSKKSRDEDDDVVGFDDKGNNNNDDDEEEEEEAEDEYHTELEEDERIKIGLMRNSEIDKELLQLRKEVNTFKMREGERKANKSKSEMRKKWAKSQMNAVKTGKQKQAYFLNEKQMKINQVREELQEAKKVGVQAANSFVERRLKKRFDAKHLRR